MTKHTLPSLLIALGCAILLSLSARAATPAWMTNYEDARALSKRIEHPLLLVFLSSDHSAPSMRMEDEVFNTSKFCRYAAKHFVLVRIDFRENQAGQDPALLEQNERLREKYNVNEMPTCIVLDSKERLSKSIVGYAPGGPDPFIEALVPVERD
ncbi:MAG: thioredoxin family protein [Verrucomicrobium sp.]|nr:thioredoxin family protein [Verrucomicrobium sp.]